MDITASTPLDAVKQPERPKLRDIMGPGLITGASDDDPSGIATYSQAGAQYGYSLGWTLLLTYPLMCAIQMVSARIGRVTGRGLAGNMRRHYPAPLLYALVGVLVVANTINIGADLGAMAAALKLLIDGPNLIYVLGFGIVTVLLEVFVRYSRYVSVLRWLTLSLFAYVACVFAVGVPWLTVARDLVLPKLDFSAAQITVIVAIFGTTISPYLFFWQASEEVEDEEEDPAAKPLLEAPLQAPKQIARIELDTIVGMGLSNIIALFIVLTTAATLNAHGVTDIQSSSQAAEALRPIAGRFAFVIFALGIIGTGLLALPVLAGSAAFGVGEALGWEVGLAKVAGRARSFYGTIAVATLVGAALNFTPIDPIKALFWSAVLNGLAAVPIMVLVMLMASREDVMGQFTLSPLLKVLGWLATAVMAAAAVGMFATWGA
jgi:NRAMP (natural resistance-associated macrophage protein)-like metal ion transporter